MAHTVESLTQMRRFVDSFLEKGGEPLELRFASKVDAARFREQLSRLRSADRRASRALFPPDDERHATTPYDHVGCRQGPDPLSLVLYAKEPYAPDGLISAEPWLGPCEE